MKCLLRNIDELISKYKVEIVIFSLLIFFLLEIVNKAYFFLYKDAYWSLSFYPKMIIQFLFILPVLFRFKWLSFYYRGFVIFSILLLLIGWLQFDKTVVAIMGGLKHFNKLILFFYVYIYLDILKPELKRILHVLDFIFIVSSAVIFLGFIFQIEVLKSYPFTERFGFSGLFTRRAINDTSLFFLIACYYLYFRWKLKQVKLIVFIFVFGASFLVGTKAIYLQNILLLLYAFWADKKNRLFYTFLGLGILVFLLFFYNFSFWNQYLQDENIGLIGVLTSLRSNLLLQHTPELLANLSIKTVLFGYFEPFQYFVEMDMVDLFISMGFFGGSLIILFYIKILFQFKRTDYFAWMFISVFIILIHLSGRYMYSGVNLIYFPLFLYYLREYHCFYRIEQKRLSTFL